MPQPRHIALFAVCVLGLSACETVPTVIDWEQEQIERGKTILAECAAVQCTRLDLDSAALEDYSVLNDMPHVTALMVSYTAFSELGTIAGMTQLEELHIGDTDVSNLSGLAAFPNLKVLHVQRMRSVADFAPVTGLSKLEELAIGDSQFDQISVIRALPRLKRLMLEVSSEADLSPMEGHAGLETVDFGFSQIEDISVLLTLPRLREAGVPEYWDDSPLKAVAEALIARGVEVYQQPVIVVC
jgi:hypothetical protein